MVDAPFEGAPVGEALIESAGGDAGKSERGVDGELGLGLVQTQLALNARRA
jgi:hypothetical protein